MVARNSFLFPFRPFLIFLFPRSRVGVPRSNSMMLIRVLACLADQASDDTVACIEAQKEEMNLKCRMYKERLWKLSYGYWWEFQRWTFTIAKWKRYLSIPVTLI